MKLEKYPYLSVSDHTVYEFLSECPKGSIKKVVIYQLRPGGFYNLAFGDWDELHQKVDDTFRSNNNDRDKILATVASTAIDFLKFHPDATLFVQGSPAARTRLYQMGLAANLQEISTQFDLIGFLNNQWEPFTKRKNYQTFALRSK